MDFKIVFLNNDDDFETDSYTPDLSQAVVRAKKLADILSQDDHRSAYVSVINVPQNRLAHIERRHGDAE